MKCAWVYVFFHHFIPSNQDPGPRFFYSYCLNITISVMWVGKYLDKRYIFYLLVVFIIFFLQILVILLKFQIDADFWWCLQHSHCLLWYIALPTLICERLSMWMLLCLLVCEKVDMKLDTWSDKISITTNF